LPVTKDEYTTNTALRTTYEFAYADSIGQVENGQVKSSTKVTSAPTTRRSIEVAFTAKITDDQAAADTAKSQATQLSPTGFAAAFNKAITTLNNTGTITAVNASSFTVTKPTVTTTGGPTPTPTPTPTPALATVTQVVTVSNLTTSEFNIQDSTVKPYYMLGYCTLHSFCTGNTPIYSTGVSLAATASDRRASSITFVSSIGSSSLAVTILASTQTKTTAQLAAAVNTAAAALGNPFYSINANQLVISPPIGSGSLAQTGSSSNVVVIASVASVGGFVCLLVTVIYAVMFCKTDQGDQGYNAERKIEQGPNMVPIANQVSVPPRTDRSCC